MPPSAENSQRNLAGFAESTNVKESVKTMPSHPIKGTVVLDLGNYSAAALPTFIVTGVFLASLLAVSSWPVHPVIQGAFLLTNSWSIYSFVVAYIVFCTVWGPRFMKNRDPVKMRTTIKNYNLFQIVICSYMFYEFSACGWLTNYSYTCEPLKYTADPIEVRMVSVTYIYYLTKILDLLDTVFFVLNKKWENVSLLHLVHHSTMVMNLFFATSYMPRGQLTFSMFFNSFIHICMYGYYYLASLGPAVRPYLWWKKYLTVLQIIQLVSVFLHLGQTFFNGCNVALGIMGVSMFCALMYIVLFLDFYFKSYKKTSKSKTKSEITEDLLKKESKPVAMSVYPRPINQVTEILTKSVEFAPTISLWKDL